MITGIYQFELVVAGTGPFTSLGISSPAVPYTNHDVLKAGGTLDMTGSILNLSVLPGSGFNRVSELQLARCGRPFGVGEPTIGTLSGADVTGIPASRFSTFAFFGGVYLNYTPVPEPSVISFLGLCGVTAGAVRWLR